MVKQFEHGCDSCIFLGNIYSSFSETKEADVYFCNPVNNPLTATLVIRYSSEGSDYFSSDLPILFRLIWTSQKSEEYRAALRLLFKSKLVTNAFLGRAMKSSLM